MLAGRFILLFIGIVGAVHKKLRSINVSVDGVNAYLHPS
jgi:hypothetical protein